MGVLPPHQARFIQMAANGFTASFIPREYGGGGASCVDLALAAEEFCRVEVGVATTLLANALALHPGAHYWTVNSAHMPFSACGSPSAAFTKQTMT